MLKPSYGFKDNQAFDKVKKYYQTSFVFALIWSIGTTCYERYQDAFDQQIRKVFGNANIPHSDTVYGFYVDPVDSAFMPWMDKAPEFVWDKDQQFFNIMVPTIDTVRYSFVTEILIDSQKMVYVTGPSGTGKSVMVSSLLRAIKEPRMVDPVSIIFSAQTSSYTSQISIESRLEKKKQFSYGARAGRKVAIFIDDINMPSAEEYGA
jgi:dynein heavy chain, axonemal